MKTALISSLAIGDLCLAGLILVASGLGCACETKADPTPEEEVPEAAIKQAIVAYLECIDFDCPQKLSDVVAFGANAVEPLGIVLTRVSSFEVAKMEISRQTPYFRVRRRGPASGTRRLR